MFETNLINLLMMFRRHPYMLQKILLKNHVFTEEFVQKLSRTVFSPKPYFFDSEQMIEYYTQLIQDTTPILDHQDKWNQKLSQAIAEQRFEDAARIRDYMKSKKYQIYL